MEKLLTLTEASELSGVSKKSIRHMDNTGKIRVIRNSNGYRLIPESEIETIKKLKDNNTKVCNLCKLEKTKNEFPTHRNVCVECFPQYNKDNKKKYKSAIKIGKRKWEQENRERHLEIKRNSHKRNTSTRKKYYNMNKKKWFISHIKNTYNLTEEQYIELVKSAEGKCNICKCECDNLHIDHDHETGKVRGLLCVKCNTALGKFKDSPEILNRAISYLCQNSDKVVAPIGGNILYKF